MKTSTFCCFVMSLVFVMPGFSQTVNGDIHNRDLIISSETMHIHFDKDIYLPGETIWFKAYLYNVNEISFSSTNFYAAVYDEKWKLIQQKQYPILEGTCNGDFKIPDSIPGSRLQFRAFTKAMIINDSNNIYERVLTVYNKEDQDNVTANKSISFQFFPEGGQMIAELQNHVAFKAVYPDGSPAMLSGQIIEVERNKVVDSFFTNSMGLGKFVLIPSPHKTYMAAWKDESGIAKQTPLPGINRYGVSFHTEIINKEVQYTIAKNRTSDSLSLLHLLVQMGNYRVYKADLVVPNEMELSTAKFSIDSMPAGLLQLTLFDKDWNPLQERLMFINDGSFKNQSLVNADTINISPKGRNTIEISLPDTMFTNLSASIADINFYDQPNTHSINQDILFSTQLKGITQNMNSLLNSGNNGAIDLVTLTYPWKKYNWQKLVNKDEVKPESLDNYITLSVNYKEKNFALPKDETLNLIINNKGRGKQFYNLQPISQTGYRKTDLVFFDSVKVSYQMNKNKELVNNLTISKDDVWQATQIINALPERISFMATKPTATQSNIEAFANNSSIKLNDTLTIKEVVVKAKYHNPELARIEELDKIYTTGMFSGTVRGFQLNVLDDPLAKINNQIGDYVVYRVPGVKLIVDEMTGEKYFVRAESVSPVKKELKFVPVFLDELRLDNIGFVDMADVAYIKYIPGIVIGGTFLSTVGAIYIYTKKGNEVEPSNNNMRSVYVKGYNGQKQFINPDYSDKELLKQPDLRTTLYWNPNILLDKTNNKVKIEYYNNDVSKKLLLTIEGVNEKGKLIHIEKIIE
ncbi:MAG: hypothetical protein ABI666_00180 [Ferruginibacter sp.]